MIRRIKIVATVGPSCSERIQLANLIKAGVDVFRLNFSHGELEQKGKWVTLIRELATELNKNIAILADLQGPKIRTGLMKNGGQQIESGQKVVITTADVLGADGVIPTTYAALPYDIAAGNQILLDDGKLELEVLRVEDELVHCLVKVGGILKDRKGINLPRVNVSSPAMTEKDFADLEFIVTQQIDWLALSFVRTADEVNRLKQLLAERKSTIKVIAKIEKPEAVDNFAAILEASDGIMVARGDLGVEVPSEQVPLIQKRIINACNQQGKPVITATQMLESMIDNPRPTRAETSDVANAILDGTDAVMLSGETAAGLYPIEAVRVMDRVARDVEGDPELKALRQFYSSTAALPNGTSDVIGLAACNVAENIEAEAILAFTQTGNTAILAARHQPLLPIIAITPNPQVQRHLALYRGIDSMLVDIQGGTESQIASVETAVLKRGLFKPGDIVIITLGSPVAGSGTTNLLKIHQLV